MFCRRVNLPHFSSHCVNLLVPSVFLFTNPFIQVSCGPGSALVGVRGAAESIELCRVQFLFSTDALSQLFYKAAKTVYKQSTVNCTNAACMSCVT